MKMKLTKWLLKNKRYKNIKILSHLRKNHLYGKELKIVNWEELYLMFARLELELNCQMLYQKVEEKNKIQKIVPSLIGIIFCEIGKNIKQSYDSQPLKILYI